MRVHFTGVAILLFLLSSIPASAQTPVSGLSLVALGDSIPFAGFCTDCELGFVDDFAVRLGKQLGREVTVTNRSRNDAAVLDQIKYQVKTEELLRAQLSTADIVILSAGYNDGPPWIPDHPCASNNPVTNKDIVDQFLSYTDACLDEAVTARAPDLNELFDEIKALTPPGSQVLVINFYNQWTGWPELTMQTAPELLKAFDANLVSFLDRWNAQLCSLATTHGFRCVDLYHAFNGPDGDTPAGDLLELDYAHPSKKGNALIADILMKMDLYPTLATPAS